MYDLYFKNIILYPFLLSLHPYHIFPFMNKQPQLMSLSHIHSLLTPHLQQLRKNLFINNEIMILHGDPILFRILMKQQPPFIINDHRMGILVCGEMRVNINLVEKHLTAGTLVFIGPGTIINAVNISDNAEIYGFALSPDFPIPFPADQIPAAFNGQMHDFQLPATKADIDTAYRILDIIWHIVHLPHYDHLLISSLVAAQMHHYNTLFRRYIDCQQNYLSHEQSIFNRFIHLINQHAVQEHQLAFYASRMCLTERYLSSIIHHTSGITAKKWIDRALISRIQVELRHTSKSIVQISNEMNFPNPAFFCKYFKRITGMTPLTFKRN